MKYNILITLCTLLVACGHPSIPNDIEKVNTLPDIYPDYTEVTIPANLCPTNFMMNDCEEIVAQFSNGDISYTYGDSKKVMIDEGEWAELRNAAATSGKPISVSVFAKKDGKWKGYKPFSIYVAKEEIDRYISYRLIQPSYVAYEDLTIDQRDLTTYEQTNIYNNSIVGTEKDGQCINCHSYKNYKTDNMLFHMRQSLGGTMLVTNGQLKKIDLKTDSTLSAGVYPSWHPTQNLIAFSTNNTQQAFFTKGKAKIEVFDTESDLILYDVEKNEVSTICNDTTELEVFPTWSPDGTTLYYCSAHIEYPDTTSKTTQIMNKLDSVKYSIYKRSFDLNTHKFGDREVVFDAAAQGKSATLPRLSPDGRYLVFALGNYGCFHVWHAEADIYMLDLKTGTVNNLTNLNSNQSESYPSFSSNGRWIMTDSRRDDGNYTRPCISYFDKNGTCHKAFMIPQEDPEFYTQFTRSYNRPEFMTEAVRFTPKEFAEKAKTNPEKAAYKR